MRCFSILIGELKERIDPLYFSQDIFRHLGSHIKVVELGSVIKTFKSGFAAGKSNQSDLDHGIVHIRPTNINNIGQLIFDKNIYIDSEIVNEKPDQVLNTGEVLFNNTNSQEWIGKTTYFEQPGNFVCSNHITRITTNSEELLPKYLTILLNLYS